MSAFCMAVQAPAMDCGCSALLSVCMLHHDASSACGDGYHHVRRRSDTWLEQSGVLIRAGCLETVACVSGLIQQTSRLHMPASHSGPDRGCVPENSHRTSSCQYAARIILQAGDLEAASFSTLPRPPVLSREHLNARERTAQDSQKRRQGPGPWLRQGAVPWLSSSLLLSLSLAFLLSPPPWPD